ncbi:hypothetical protein DYD21_19355 [Rhodohalobacter sp. SW132]|uniref:hypothetical protein n=1 Tax=Rhodohalobacter sp. SW132 TaxID=2293433 RepID=UPI000E22D22D|nr:hypothetical protein [Rhodohalobacter sp. SW132]REL24139.1 hypothetical protein DYD21_19355 [Rhodohalobacter sp. SW132]
MGSSFLKFLFLTTFTCLLVNPPVTGQFLETFDSSPSTEWRTPTGDGEAESDLLFENGSATFVVDATNDRRNIWWAIMQTTVSEQLDLEQLADPSYELRIEARVRTSHAPRRINLHLNTQRTTDFHSHLVEFDLPDTTKWHTVSMTTSGFDGRPGDTVNGHIALMDWGNEIYRLEVEYFRVDIVNTDEAEPDHGEQVVYPPPEPEPDQFEHTVPVADAGMIDRQFPGINMSGWRFGNRSVLTTDATKMILMRWELDEYKDKNVSGYGMLELTPFHTAKTVGADIPEYDQVRLVEVLGGDSSWNRDEVTFDSFTHGQPLNRVLNPQMIIDIDLPETMDQPVQIHIPRPVLQRMVEGKTKGIALYPLGPLHASFYFENRQDGKHQPRLYFNTEH